ncbi:hypothetical protein Vsou_20280 [Vulcanisaeta souniana JCM 11219]|uniref:Uroporphyrin-III c-methyltransferase n=3 Tax=Vulcanisaeta souniana TaxID=164452 RepID=A0ABM8BPJ3_9CREN|nr:DUF488 family protein [Vulcanisaeta souniana]BDR92935.1 hypothetical protein Vsou_20280 [Vulcanisaeta souniana JCM 11219]
MNLIVLMMRIKVKRIYDEPDLSDGVRVLVDRLWPRGLSRERARIDVWLRDLAPSDELRRWFNHDPAKWDEFRLKYWSELDRNINDLSKLLSIIRGNGAVTLLYATRDRLRNNAVALAEYLRVRYGFDYEVI